MHGSQADLQAMRWRCIGPPRGGRVVAVAGHPTDLSVFYFGACAGGVWKTTDAGSYWENISDGYFNTAAVGALSVAESDPNVIYAGTGESTIRADVSYGDGVYRSADGGASWAHAGLGETRHIGKIRVHPLDPDLVYVAALGHAFGPNPERGVFRSHDGGRQWENVLFRSDKAGAVDLSMDPHNPRRLFASIWQAQRTFWTLSSGGPDSSLYRSVDGGDSWVELSNNPGLPKGPRGKIGVVVSPADCDRVWAIVEAEDAGLYRSDDGGDSWELVCGSRDLIHRPFYYCHVFADPLDRNTVYVLNLQMWKSTDGGRTFVEVTTPHGDNHDLWIDPENPSRMVEGNDGGACVTWNGGTSWSTIFNQMTAQFYRVDTDNQFPYRVYATQQDNSSLSVPSATEYGAILWSHCHTPGTGESGDIAVHPDDANIVYIGSTGSSPGGAGVLQRYDHHTKQLRLVSVWPEEYFGWDPKDLKYRFSWTFPICFSPHDPKTLYVAGNIIFRTKDEGVSWEAISPDLSRNDPSRLMASGGDITKDQSGAEMYGTVFAFAESPIEKGLLWGGTDDGLIHVSADAGASWTNVTPPSLPEWSRIGGVEPSSHDAATAYVAATRYKLDQYQPYLFKTTDRGQSWTEISSGFPQGEITRVVREDPECAGLLYVGTETGVCVSCDGGDSWQRLQTNLPVVPVYDLKVKDADLVAATHGRSFWILDDLTPLRQRCVDTADAADAAAHLFAPAPAYRRWLNWAVGAIRTNKEGDIGYMLALGAHAAYRDHTTEDGEWTRTYLDAGENPPHGAVIYYRLDHDAGDEPISLRFLDASGQTIKAFSSRTVTTGATGDEDDRFAPAEAGLNRFVWDMRYPSAQSIKEDSPLRQKAEALLTERRQANGPFAPPGSYQVQLQVGDRVVTQPLDIRPDPRVTATEADFAAQFALWMRIRDRLSEANNLVDRLRRLQRQVAEWSRRATEGDSQSDGGAVVDAAASLNTGLEAIEAELVQTKQQTSADSLRLPVRLCTRVGGLINVVAAADAAPTKQVYELFEERAAEVDEVSSRVQAIIDNEVRAFNDLIKKSTWPPVSA
jgi:photosystem II stability/assembly factor-like uncharacterized protein